MPGEIPDPPNAENKEIFETMSSFVLDSTVFTKWCILSRISQKENESKISI